MYYISPIVLYSLNTALTTVAYRTFHHLFVSPHLVTTANVLEERVRGSSVLANVKMHPWQTNNLLEPNFGLFVFPSKLFILSLYRNVWEALDEAELLLFTRWILMSLKFNWQDTDPTVKGLMAGWYKDGVQKRNAALYLKSVNYSADISKKVQWNGGRQYDIYRSFYPFSMGFAALIRKCECQNE